jgi:putative ABC transport system permease protein
VGIRKVVGADRAHIIKQFYGESIVSSLIALFIALILVYLFLPVFNELSGKPLSLDFSGNLHFLIGIAAITVLTGMISGSYPALFLSSFQPIIVLKGILNLGTPRGGTLRKILVVGQFTFTVILIVATIIIYKQLDYIRNKDLGFDKDHMVYFFSAGDLVRNTEGAKSELLENPNILSVTKASVPITTIGGSSNINWEGKNPEETILMHPIYVDYDYLKTFKMEMAQGRFFDKKFTTDNSNYVINETAAKVMGIPEPVGKRFWWGDREGTIIGVIKDFHHNSLHSEIKPSVLRIYRGYMSICVRISSENVPETLKFLEAKWDKFVKGRYPFSYKFLDETIDTFYEDERRLGTIFQYFTFLAIFIACLGLFGLASFMAEQRTKEIGIRKVFGASAAGVVLILSKEFVKWVFISIIISLPLVWYIMSRWLQDFPYRTGIGIWTFLLAGGITLFIALSTVSYQSIKAANTNPVDTLKYE